MPTIEVIVVQNEDLKNTSFGSFRTCRNVHYSLRSTHDGIRNSVCINEGDLRDVVVRNPELIVLTNKILLTERGETIWLSQYFGDYGINHTGSCRQALEYDVDKTASKAQVASHGIATARCFTAIPREHRNEGELPLSFPLFVKPNNSANSDGIDGQSFTESFSGFEEKVKQLYSRYGEPVLVEEYLPGREFTVAIIDADTTLVAPIEIVAPLHNSRRILSKSIKRQDTEDLRAITDPDIYREVTELALQSFRALGARDFGRIDVKMDGQGKCCFIEANLTPGMTKGSSYFPKSFEMCHRLNYDQVVNLIAQSALRRGQRIRHRQVDSRQLQSQA